MSEYTANVAWQRDTAPFVDNRYSRAHVWRFDGGAEVRASSSPHSVPPPLSDPRSVDPEEAFVASLHDRAHDECDIANSVSTVVTIDVPAGRG